MIIIKEKKGMNSEQQREISVRSEYVWRVENIIWVRIRIGFPDRQRHNCRSGDPMEPAEENVVTEWIFSAVGRNRR